MECEVRSNLVRTTCKSGQVEGKIVLSTTTQAHVDLAPAQRIFTPPAKGERLHREDSEVVLSLSSLHRVVHQHSARPSPGERVSYS
ncbi:hypothetical protein NDN08_003798 [Rhodosorus marinus]|uniref:Uncharacterized protein n=1 Tax=Rhodosorus marinus TaxID=101924 RepID=A0AAV8UGG3_9RHOD|nr:hypothetical protein NDN08_003798 [Rhodosorus marinus]